jgi:hypothetical protein
VTSPKVKLSSTDLGSRTGMRNVPAQPVLMVLLAGEHDGVLGVEQQASGPGATVVHAVP